MSTFSKLLKKRQERIAQQFLSQIDTIGSTLNHIGIKNNVNRHTLIGQAWMQKHRLEGELQRMDLLFHTSIRPFKKFRNKVDQGIDGAIDHLPKPLASRFHKTHNRIKRISGGC